MKLHMPKTRSLRTTLTRALVALTLVSVFASVSLVIVSHSLNRVSRELSRSLQSIHFTEEAELQLLVHDRLSDPLARTQTEWEVRWSLDAVADFTDTGLEAGVLDDSAASVDAYFSTAAELPPGDPRIADELERAFRDLNQLSEMNFAQSQVARKDARRLNRLANAITIASVVIFLVVVPLVLWWLHTRAFRPTRSLADAMRQFADGRWNARAPESGPTELRDMAAQFNEMASRLDEQREARATFIAGVAHDIRTPVGALKLSAEAIPEDRPLPSEEQVRKVLGIVRRQAGRLERMADDLMQTTRTEAGDIPLSMDRHDIRDVARSVAHLYSETSSDHPVVLEVPDEPVWVHCDADRIEQVFTNIASNAIKYSPSGGEIRLRVWSEQTRVRVSFSDRGVGISPREQQRLFEPFFRAQRTDRDVGGTGLGLPVARRLVEAHDGTIEVDSAVGRGTTITISLPLLDPPDENHGSE